MLKRSIPFLFTATLAILTACQPGPLLAPQEIPNTPESVVHFQKFKATFISSLCLRCHNSTITKGGIDLSSLEAISKKRGLLSPGDPENSMIFQVVAEGRMPPNEFLSGEQTSALELWIQSWPGMEPAEK